ncbi:MAG: elongation factor P [bacterium]
MSQLQYSEIREKKIIIYNDDPCEVVESHVARTQQRKPQNQVKLKSLITGKTIAATFHVADTAEEADISKKEVKFLYHNRGEFWFCDPEDPKNRFKLDEQLMDNNTAKFLKPNENAIALVWDDDDEEKTIKVSLPVKMEFKVKEAPPAVRGDTSKSGNKIITLENGATLNAPMFINEGDTIRVNTETGEYVERV